MMIHDNFIASYPELKELANSAEFSDVKNPVDAVIYPEIYWDIPVSIKAEIIQKLSDIVGRDPENITMFMRRSPLGVPVPHIAHTDNSMGKYSLMLYLFERQDSGTAFIRHRSTGIMYAPESEEFLSIVRADQNNTSKWEVVDMADAKENRAVIFDAGKFHCAMPIGGFGEGAEARTVLTVFFS
jgi:hypothetical protein